MNLRHAVCVKCGKVFDDLIPEDAGEVTCFACANPVPPPARRHNVRGCPTCDRERRAANAFHPSHDPSPQCKSGHHVHCSCDNCF